MWHLHDRLLQAADRDVILSSKKNEQKQNKFISNQSVF